MLQEVFILIMALQVFLHRLLYGFFFYMKSDIKIQIIKTEHWYSIAGTLIALLSKSSRKIL